MTAGMLFVSFYPTYTNNNDKNINSLYMSVIKKQPRIMDLNIKTNYKCSKESTYEVLKRKLNLALNFI